MCFKSPEYTVFFNSPEYTVCFKNPEYTVCLKSTESYEVENRKNKITNLRVKFKVVELRNPLKKYLQDNRPQFEQLL